MMSAGLFPNRKERELLSRRTKRYLPKAYDP